MMKIMLVMMLFFLVIFALLHFTGFLTFERIKLSLEAAKGASAYSVALIVILLMFADLFIAVPTIPVMSLSGYFLGVLWGGTASSIGLILAGVVGYWLSSKYGDRLMKRILKNEKERMEAILTYQEHGAVVILLSRAVPMLPEISACMAGMTKMPFGKFLILWLSSIIPCSFVAAYAGSVSSVEDPRPAILTAVGISVSYWLAWFIFTRLKKKKGLSASSSSD